MAALVTSKEVEAIVRSTLAPEGYKSVERGYGETGTDIIAKSFGARDHGTRGARILHK